MPNKLTQTTKNYKRTLILNRIMIFKKMLCKSKAKLRSVPAIETKAQT